jgi:hypothetical protein
MTQWILIIWAMGAFVVLRWGSVPAMVNARKRAVAEWERKWPDRYDRAHYAAAKTKPAHLWIYLMIAVLIGMCWPFLALYKLIWPRGIDYKAKKEARLKQEAEEEEARIREAERVLREFNLRNPTE